MNRNHSYPYNQNYLLTESEVTLLTMSDSAVSASRPKLDIFTKDLPFEVKKYFIIWHFFLRGNSLHKHIRLCARISH